MKKFAFSLAAIAAFATLSFSALAQDFRPYLKRDALPDGALYLPAPPDTASLRFFDDWVQHRWGKSLRDTPRGAQAAAEADGSHEGMAAVFSEAFGCQISRKATPAIFELLARSSDTASGSTGKAKVKYMRKRPYVQYGEPTLVPSEEESHRRTGSYPSSHSAMGWGAALVLSEVNPACAEAILKAGYEYGQSRVIAGYHYQSDVDAGRLAAAAAVARLHTDAGFLKDLEKAKKEFKRLSGRK
ncbi:MAG: phosphatase PAP2 family protein [Bacteroidales bacterium]|nr:phosphatase PAP2 family protein [Bacteroidales bacterium]